MSGFWYEGKSFRLLPNHQEFLGLGYVVSCFNPNFDAERISSQRRPVKIRVIQFRNWPVQNL